MIKNVLGRVFSFLSFTMLLKRLIYASSLLTDWKNHFQTESGFSYLLLFMSIGSSSFGKWSKDLGFGSFVGIVSLSFIVFVLGTQS